MHGRTTAPVLAALRLASDPEGELDRSLGRDVAATVMGLDRLERRLHRGAGPLDGEGLVPIWIGDDLVEIARFASWDDADEALADLRQRVGALGDGPRRDALASIVTSVQAASELFQGATLRYAEKLERLVQVPAGPVEPDRFAALQATLDASLLRAGLRAGPLAERVRRWESERTLDPVRLSSTYDELMAEARARTESMVVPVGDDTMKLEPVRDVPYTARCRFAEGRMELNVDLGITRAALKSLVAHEVFPGHAAQLLATRDAVEAGGAYADVLTCTLNGATGAVQEGIGEQAAALIDWLEDADDHVQSALRRLQTAAQASAAWWSLEEGWDDDRVRAWLRDEACGQPAWVEGRLRFAQHPFRGPFIASYWHGDEAVREVRERTPAADRAAFVAYLYGRSHSVASLLRFDPADAVDPPPRGDHHAPR